MADQGKADEYVANLRRLSRDTRIRWLYGKRAPLTRVRRMGYLSAEGQARLDEINRLIDEEEAAELADKPTHASEGEGGA